MINKEEMLALVRSVAVHDDVEQGMGHAFDLGVDWERARIEKVLKAQFGDLNQVPNEFFSALEDIRKGVEYP